MSHFSRRRVVPAVGRFIFSVSMVCGLGSPTALAGNGGNANDIFAPVVGFEIQNKITRDDIDQIYRSCFGQLATQVCQIYSSGSDDVRCEDMKVEALGATQTFDPPGLRDEALIRDIRRVVLNKGYIASSENFNLVWGRYRGEELSFKGGSEGPLIRVTKDHRTGSLDFTIQDVAVEFSSEIFRPSADPDLGVKLHDYGFATFDRWAIDQYDTTYEIEGLKTGYRQIDLILQVFKDESPLYASLSMARVSDKKHHGVYLKSDWLLGDAFGIERAGCDNCGSYFKAPVLPEIIYDVYREVEVGPLGEALGVNYVVDPSHLMVMPTVKKLAADRFFNRDTMRGLQQSNDIDLSNYQQCLVSGVANAGSR